MLISSLFCIWEQNKTSASPLLQKLKSCKSSYIQVLAHVHAQALALGGRPEASSTKNVFPDFSYTMFCEGFITILDLSMPSTQVKNVPTVRTMFKGTKV